MDAERPSLHPDFVSKKEKNVLNEYLKSASFLSVTWTGLTPKHGGWADGRAAKPTGRGRGCG